MAIPVWEAWYSALFVLGMVINSYCLSLKNSNAIRYSILVTAPMLLVYDIFVLSFGGIVYQSVVITSSVIGLIRYRKAKGEQKD